MYVNTTTTFQINELSTVAYKVYSSNISNTMQAAKSTCISFLFNVLHRRDKGCELYLQRMVMPTKKRSSYL